MSTFFEAEYLNINANSIGNTQGVSSTESGCATVYIVPVSGTHATHVIDIQVSPNGGEKWITIDQITGVGVKMVTAVADQWRLRVSTAEGLASDVNAYILGR